MKNILILITDKNLDAWARELAQIVTPLGMLKAIGIDEFSAAAVPAGCELIIIDTTAVTFKTAADLLAQLNMLEHRHRVIVMTASPNWQNARTAFEAGAMDYISKNLPPAEVFRCIQAVMKKPVSRQARPGTKS
jgi:DNA-binding NtrC family response regulator